MKIRTGFVSNSSSSSYVVKVHVSEPCPTCGRRTPNIVDHIRGRYSVDDETGMICDSKEEILANMDAEIVELRKYIKEYSTMDPNEVPARYYLQWGYKRTASQLMESTHADLSEIYNRRKIIEEADGEVCEISISYHDEYTNQILQDGIKDGSIEVIGDRN